MHGSSVKMMFWMSRTENIREFYSQSLQLPLLASSVHQGSFSLSLHTLPCWTNNTNKTHSLGTEESLVSAARDNFLTQFLQNIQQDSFQNHGDSSLITIESLLVMEQRRTHYLLHLSAEEWPNLQTQLLRTSHPWFCRSNYQSHSR